MRKTCAVCGTEKRTDEFYSQSKYSKNKGNWLYYNPECKECTKKRAIAWHKSHPDEAKRMYKKRDEKPATRKKLHLHNKRRLENGKYKEWQRNNPDKVRQNAIYRQMHKAHKISNEEWENCKNYFNYRCAYCGMAIENHFIKFNGEMRLGDFHKEHADHEGANDLSNCVPACKTCNSTKHTSNLEEWMTMKSIPKDFRNKIYRWLEEDYLKYIKIN